MSIFISESKQLSVYTSLLLLRAARSQWLGTEKQGTSEVSGFGSIVLGQMQNFATFLLSKSELLPSSPDGRLH